MLRLLLGVSVVVVLAAGCASVESHVTTYLSPNLTFPSSRESNTMAVIAKTTPEEPLLENEVARKVEILLRQQGYETQALGEASYVLLVYFAIDAGNTVSGNYTAYVPGGTAYTNIYTGNGRWAVATTQLPGRTEQRSYSYTFYTRYLGATLYDHKMFAACAGDRKDAAVVWRGITTSAGKSSDLRSVIDYLLVATLKHFGADTGKQVTVTLGAGDKRVKALREAAQAELPGQTSN